MPGYKVCVTAYLVLIQADGQAFDFKIGIAYIAFLFFAS